MENKTVWTVDKVRETFVNFYKKNQHENIHSSAVVPHDVSIDFVSWFSGRLFNFSGPNSAFH